MQPVSWNVQMCAVAAADAAGLRAGILIYNLRDLDRSLRQLTLLWVAESQETFLDRPTHNDLGRESVSR